MSLPYYKRFPRDFLDGTVGFTLEQKGAYSLLIDIFFDQERSLPDDPRRIAAAIGCSVRKWNQLRAFLMSSGEIKVSDGHILISMVERFTALEGRTSLPASIRLAVFERDGWRCAYCDTHTGPFHVDHIFPVSKGGTDDMENLTCSCMSCNLSKGAKTVEEWAGC